MGVCQEKVVEGKLGLSKTDKHYEITRDEFRQDVIGTRMNNSYSFAGIDMRTTKPVESKLVEKKPIIVQIPSIELIRTITKSANYVDNDTFNRYKSECINEMNKQAKAGRKYSTHHIYQIKPDGASCAYTNKLIKELKDVGYTVILKSNNTYIFNDDQFAIVWSS